MTKVLIYGATGFTGRAISIQAKRSGLDILLAGRNPDNLKPLSKAIDVPYLAADVRDCAQLDKATSAAGVVVNVAGPFQDTAAPVLESCMRTQAHYLDVSGELSSFLLCQRYHQRALERGIMVMPGLGFVVAPSDCLAAYLKQCMPDAETLRIAFSRVDLVSRGTMRAMLGMVRKNVCIRRHGELVMLPVGQLERRFDFGQGGRTSAALSWADLVTAYESTGIPNIETYAEMGPWLRGAYQLGAWYAEPLRMVPARWASEMLLRVWPEGPDEKTRAGKRRVIVAEVENRGRWLRSARLTLPDGYTITPPIVINALQELAKGQVRTGFSTPAQVFGADFILGCPGVSRSDI